MIPGLLISAPSSGSGKTVVTLGLIAAFRAMGLRVQPFKCGPDYIDPAFHTAAAGRASLNLDAWAMTASDLVGRIAGVPAADIAVAEGAMGLFDGVTVPGACGTGAAADIAALTGWPVVLVIDAGRMAQSAGAIAAGFARFRAGVRVSGVVLNRVGSSRHSAMLRQGLAAAGVVCFGALPRNAGLALPERHLGLVQAAEQADLPAWLDRAGAMVAGHCDLAAIRAAAVVVPPTPIPSPQGGGEAPPSPLAGEGWGGGACPAPRRLPPPGQRVAVARDAAFSFLYPHMLDDWRAQGAEVLPFSPLADQAPDDSADACWLPGGYPELHGPVLAGATRFRDGLRRFAETRPVHGECGGYMALGQAIIGKDGVRYPMAGLLGLVTSFADRRMHLGYRQAVLAAPAAGQAQGARLVGHEFHYATIVDQPDAPLATVYDATCAAVPETGSRRGHVTGTFFHLIGPAA
jgi:cobyrinic acid a,c-diamide synthase